MDNIKVYELCPVYDSRKSFYGKATVIHTPGGSYLKSYGTIVCGIIPGAGFVRYWSGWSATTARHVNEFRQQARYSAISKSEWERLAVVR